ncbi:MAG: hypothetical protein ABSG21_15930 [Spirochaetia bacterium]|jgi:hypothetical protein
MNKPIKSGTAEVIHNLLLSVPVSRRARLLQCLSITLLLVAAGAACAASLDAGLGYSSVWVKNDANGVNGSSGYVAVAFDFEFANTWSLGMFMSGGTVSTGDIQMYPPDSADYSLLFIGLRKSLWSLNDHIWTPWIEVGGGITGLVWHTYAYQTSGEGLVLGGGVDVRMGPLVLRAQYLYHDISTTDPYECDAGSLSGNVVSVLFMFWFRIW